VIIMICESDDKKGPARRSGGKRSDKACATPH
jgi:hypothetical protein